MSDLRKVYLTQDARWAVEKALRAAGYEPTPDSHAGEWRKVRRGNLVHLADVFPSPLPGRQTEVCVCWRTHGALFGLPEADCPAHGEPVRG